MQLSVSPLKLSTHLESVMCIRYSGEQEPVQHFSMLNVPRTSLADIISHTAVNIHTHRRFVNNLVKQNQKVEASRRSFIFNVMSRLTVRVDLT